MVMSAATAREAARAVGDFVGLPPLAAVDLGHLAAAAGIVAATALIARFLSGRLDRWLQASVMPKFDVAEHKIHIASNHLAAALAAVAAVAILNMAVLSYGWPPYSHLLFDITIALSAAIAAWRLAFAFNISPSGALALAVVSGFLVLSSRYEQLAGVERSLDGLAASLGGTRISLLDVFNFAFAAVVLYALVRLANRGAKAFIRHRTNLDVTQSLLAEKLAAIAIVVVAIFIAIDMVGIDTTALSIFSGTIGLGLGFGLQKIFSNLVSGIILLMDRSIKPGDVIVVGDAVGEVNRIGTRAVSVITRDGKEYLIPNELLMTERVENWNYSSRNVRIRMSVRVGYDSDFDLVERLLQETSRESPRVLNTPAPTVRITDLSDAGIKVELRIWISDPEDGLGNIQSEIYKRILAKFRENRIDMPNPAREVQITRLPEITLRREDHG